MSLSGEEPSEHPLVYDSFIKQPDGNVKLQYLKPPSHFELPALAGISSLRTEIIDPAKYDGGADIRAIEISWEDYEKILERLKSPEEQRRQEDYFKFLQAEKVASDARVNAMDSADHKYILNQAGSFGGILESFRKRCAEILGDLFRKK
ncbi:hypothetical protein BU23DRAFT_600442 [Bimuria novae-zelandiae CBS 107.79]|uniref:Uncharacterized protein n=1 Tax=Bimuria novae-zelandiae CBS 107.79 TaxID=1447943 RepID=A0A6A5V4Y1_9PLEO|nr:hypothetical protein BU23DRAFT_600442 [Bimuria novae-zelandiae CBS 107.79]